MSCAFVCDFVARYETFKKDKSLKKYKLNVSIRSASSHTKYRRCIVLNVIKNNIF